MTVKKKVFVFPCGSEIGLEINRALSHSTLFSVIGGSSVPDHGSYVFEDYIGGLPYIGDQALLPSLQSLIATRGIHFIFPAHDAAVLQFSEWTERRLLGDVRVMTSPHATCRVASSKSSTYKILKDLIATPRQYNSPDAVMDYPVFLKPDSGQGSKGTHKALSRAELDFHLKRDPALLILEYLPGEEYTVDCFTDRHGSLRYAGPRQRSRVANGISVSTVKAAGRRFAALANKINQALIFSGAWFFQVKERHDGELVLLEIAPRIAGASCYHRMMGVNLPLLSLFDAIGRDVEIFENPYSLSMDRQLLSHYKLDYQFRSVYVDLDDTIVVGGRTNHQLLAVLYKFKSEFKEIVLVTRHFAKYGEQSQALLKAHYVDPRLFDRIIEVSADQRKSAHVPQASAILIDDSFSERRDVALHSGVPVFDVNQAIEIFG
jgi:hypothetical protein